MYSDLEEKGIFLRIGKKKVLYTFTTLEIEDKCRHKL